MRMPRSRFSAPPSRQRGMATILIVLLAGLALTATALGVMHAVRGAQQKHVAVHAATHAQAGAWAGVEILRQYFEQLDPAELNALEVNDEISIQVGNRELHAAIVELQAPAQGSSDKRYSVTANLRNQDDAARATSTIQAVFAVTPGGSGQPSPGEPWDNVIDISGNLDMRGNIDVKGGDRAHFNVDGNVKLNNAAITGIKTLRATGDIEIGSAIQIEELFSNGNISLSGAASVLKASALGNITINSGGGSQGVLNANGNIVISNGSVGTANALGLINASSGGSHGTLTAVRTITISNGTTASANAVGSITVNNWPTVRTLSSQADVQCPSANWNNFDSIAAGGQARNCPAAPAKIRAPTSVSIALMAPLQPFTPPKPHVDAYELKDSANYVFEYRNGQILVSVRNINGISDGSYRLGKSRTNSNWWGYLCKELDGDGFCLVPLRKVTRGTWDGDQNISYSNGKWKLTGDAGDNSPAVFAPGALWFQGDVELASGKFRNTILATGNISTSGNHRTWSVNYAGYAETCNSSYYNGLYPNDFCDRATQKLKSNSLGNVALLAGGYVGNTFSGGDIELGPSSKIYGSVVAGNWLQTGGSTLISGYITVARQGDSSGSNSWGGSTTIDLQNLPPSFDPGGIPDMDGNPPCQDNCEPDDTEQPGQATLQWSRYL
ncbi:hypothetical protein D3C76_334760 [compost metagenome]